jgi:AraC-like DNA-binding protein
VSYREYRPHPALARFVCAISASDDRGEPVPGPPIRVVPDGGSDLLFSVAAPTRGRAGPCRGALFGTKTRALLVPTEVPVENLAVRFRPGAAARFLPAPAHELRDAAQDVGELWGGAGRELAERIGEARSERERVARLERALLARLASAEAGDAVADSVESAVALLVARRGSIGVRALAAEVGTGERRLERAFRARVGVRPKLLARILRFRAACAALARGGSQADVACACGYADQSHLLRDFHAFADATPARVLAERVSDSFDLSSSGRARLRAEGGSDAALA